MINKQECEICGQYGYLETHHLIFGNGLRDLSDRYKLTARVCRNCHTRIHNDKELMEWSKKKGQKIFEKSNTRVDFIRIFGRDYLSENEE